MSPPLRRDLVVAGWVAAFLSVLGAPLGLLAAAVTPHLPMSVFQDASQGYPRPLLIQVGEENRAAFGGDGVMLAVLAGAGLLLGVAALLAGRRTPGGTVLGLVAGGALAGLVAMAVHHLVLATTGLPLLPPGRSWEIRPYVRGSADFAALPFVAALVWFAGQLPWLLRGGDAPAPVSSATADCA